MARMIDRTPIFRPVDYHYPTSPEELYKMEELRKMREDFEERMRREQEEEMYLERRRRMMDYEPIRFNYATNTSGPGEITIEPVYEDIRSELEKLKDKVNGFKLEA